MTKTIKEEIPSAIELVKCDCEEGLKPYVRNVNITLIEGEPNLKISYSMQIKCKCGANGTRRYYWNNQTRKEVFDACVAEWNAQNWDMEQAIALG